MPAGGRASRNCGNCRSIKRRCDQKFPHCGQCIRAREECQGYRDEWELVFHDQTTHTIKRSKEAWAKADGLETLKRSPPSRPLSLSSDEVGVNYFLFHFVVGGLSPSRGYLNYVPAVFSADGENPTLMASMAAVGLAALANSTQQPELSQRARTKYWEAIDKVNAALSSSVESIKDSTLMSVISLGLFEHVSNFETWFQYVKGTVALVVSRGKSQFSSPASIPMFNQVRADMCAACVHRLEPFPRDMLELQEEANKQADNSSCFWLLGVLATRTVNLLSDVTVVTIKDGATLAHFVEESAVLQRDFQAVLSNFRTQEPYTTIEDYSGDPDLVYNSRYDLYRSAWAIRLWNNSRILQVIVCEIEFHLLSKALTAGLPPARRKQIATTLEATCQTLKTLGDDILATVPQSLGAVLSSTEPPTSADLSSDPSANASASGGHLLMWCLYTVGKSPVTRGRTRKWIMKRLRDIGQKSGLPIALQFVNDIDEIDKAASMLESADN
ncbi:hypothetical protein PENSOL_c001G11868 [Penicillium solitum]|uniref:Zn(2)-C6 fungal-type domain-containing protein n=1 Tax=Penicillium solitum TaxID=60172 RepID=A0A1V6RP16_9EURO|nr:uncharacterized protein PENSOL_c001G11868 [Penicillium solitum]OQE03376.1 hypothetical protein PENSOL_c001G11868 [Penicillium solitum]